jgi:isocitrate dehydrogenase
MNTAVLTRTLTQTAPLRADVIPVSVAFGDGIGPEIMKASLRIMEAADARLLVEPVEIGLKQYRRGNTSGISEDSWESLLETGLFFKAPISTPQGGGMKSINVTIRKTLGLYANVRPCQSYAPFVATQQPGTNIVIIRENEEDVYAGIEHRQTEDVVQCLKIVSRSGCERLIRYAFEYAIANNRRKITCLTKDNILKMTDGLFHKVFDEVAQDYPLIENDHYIVDIGMARLACKPQEFDVVVTMNLYGDIASDIAAEVTGSIGMAGSANIGANVSMFEAVHGSAPTIAGKDIANPSGLLLAGVMMLVHAGRYREAERIHNAWLRTIEEGVHTPDMFKDGLSRQKVGTAAFTDAVISRLGKKPECLKPVAYDGHRERLRLPPEAPPKPSVKQLVGVDVFIDWKGHNPDELAQRVSMVKSDLFDLGLITNRGVKVWPDGFCETRLTDHWRCRLMGMDGRRLDGAIISGLFMRLASAGIEFVKSENLYTFDGQPGFSMGQGE